MAAALYMVPVSACSKIAVMDILNNRQPFGNHSVVDQEIGYCIFDTGPGRFSLEVVRCSNQRLLSRGVRCIDQSLTFSEIPLDDTLKRFPDAVMR